jgi:hypothetical protein
MLVVAHQLGPAAEAAIEIVEADDPGQRIEAAEPRVGVLNGAAEIVG